MDPLARKVMLRWATSRRVVARFVATKSKEVPVRNKDYDDKIVWVLPETLKDNPSKYKQVGPKELEEPWVPPHKPKPPEYPEKPEKPRRPRKPRTPRDPLPHPAYKPKPAKPVNPARPVKPVEPVPPPKIPTPPKPTRRK